MSDEDPLPLPRPVEENPESVQPEQNTPASFQEIADQQLLVLDQKEIEIRERIVERLKEIINDPAVSEDAKQKARTRLQTEEALLHGLKGGRPPIKQKPARVSNNPYAEEQRDIRRRAAQSLRETLDRMTTPSRYGDTQYVPPTPQQVYQPITNQDINRSNLNKTFDVTFHTGKSVGRPQELPEVVGKRIYSFLHKKGGKSIKRNRNRGRRMTHRLSRRTR